MDQTQIWTILGVNGGLFLAGLAAMITLFIWNRSEANADRREAAADRRDILHLIRSMESEMKDFRNIWAQESKDFHGRLCAIEEKRNK